MNIYCTVVAATATVRFYFQALTSDKKSCKLISKQPFKEAAFFLTVASKISLENQIITKIH